MDNKFISNIKLGLFVIGGLLFLVLLLYMIGKNQNLFGSNFKLKARFENVQGLTSGNNIRYSGIQAGTVSDVRVLNDTLVEVTMLIKTSMKSYIHKNAVASIGTDGLVGNKIINITPAKERSEPVEEGDILPCKKTYDTEEILQNLAKTSNDISFIASELKTTVTRINNSKVIWSLLDDPSLPENLRVSLVNARMATARANEISIQLNQLVANVKDGKGSLGAILTDTSFAVNLNEAIQKIKLVGDEADKLAHTLDTSVKKLEKEINYGKGPVTALLKDSSMVLSFNKSLENIQKGTDGFNQVMDALKQNFLLRGYFKRMERQKKKEQIQDSFH